MDSAVQTPLDRPVDNPYLPMEAEIVERLDEVCGIFTIRLRFTDPALRRSYSFAPGQFNMVYLYGVGEVAISIVSDPQEDEGFLDHTIRALGRVTHGLERLRAGDRVGIRGPFGRGWPMAEARGKDVLVLTGGLGCAPVVSVIRYVELRRSLYGRLIIMQGVKHAEDLCYRDAYQRWADFPDTQVILAADKGGPLWPWHVGHVTDMFEGVFIAPSDTIVMMCGPEGMMRAGVRRLLELGVEEDAIYLSMERNMHCGVGHCGHCQVGGRFVCRDGPVFCYTEVKEYIGVRGF